jgi:enamine deaminase RidA (YjgF/YER057c/UK114 family)
MSTFVQNPLVSNQIADAPNWPLWVEELISARRRTKSSDDLILIEAPPYRLARIRIPGAAAFSASEFEQATSGAYARIAKEFGNSPAREAIRFWNYLPGINRPCPGGLERYKVFNSGRFAACRQWWGDDFERQLPTATGVGHDGDDLVIDALAAQAAGTAIENPRQIPAYRYTRRYGSRPPCFARATVLDGPQRRVLIGGTASVRGEDSMHEQNLAAQMRETLLNLTSLLHAAGLEALHSFTDLRVYHRRQSDAEEIAKVIAERFAAGVRVEQIRADLCRRELLVEIEGVAIG